MNDTLLKRPSAVIPIAMSVAALAIVLGYAAMFGVARQSDEGTAAHLWQLLMAGQLPIVAFFAMVASHQTQTGALGSGASTRRGFRGHVSGLVV